LISGQSRLNHLVLIRYGVSQFLNRPVILLDLHMPDDRSFNPEFVKANLSGAGVLAMSLSSDYESEEEIRRIAESFGAVTTLDKAKLSDELIPAILQTWSRASSDQAA
jgi:hypothetical protein